MPLYEYECDSCGRRFEVIQKFSDPAPDTCKLCEKGPIRRLMSSPAIQFKGSGFYITDYAQKGKSDSSSTTSSDKTDAAKSDGSSTTTSDGSSTKSDSTKSDSTKSDSTKSDSTKSDTAASSRKPSDGGTSKESKA
jgi:putative FmdB family regulatory protein